VHAGCEITGRSRFQLELREARGQEGAQAHSDRADERAQTTPIRAASGSDSGAGRITIAGPLNIRVLPSPTFVADGVRVANASRLSGPPIVEVGHFATRIAFWSLIRGPVRIKTLDVADELISTTSSTRLGVCDASCRS
jgi:hypothetical protein